MGLISAIIAIMGVTAIHEAGHWLAIRLKRGRVLRVQVGRGPTLWQRPGDPTDLVVSLVPLGGQIQYEGVPAGSGQAVVAMGGAVANLALAFAAFLLASPLLGAGAAPFRAEFQTPLAYATASTGAWFWAVPGAALELIATGSATELRAGVRGLASLLSARPLLAMPYAVGALSALWAALNPIPIPFVRTDGWHVLRAFWPPRHP